MSCIGMRCVHFDPRCKLILLALIVIAAMTAQSLKYILLLIGLLGVFAFLCGQWKKALLGVFGYIVLYFITDLVMKMSTSAIQTTLIASCGLMHKVYPCGMFAGVMISTTKVSEFLCAMDRIHAPKKLVIPFAVMLRYMPAIQEDWHFIKDAMRLRNVAPNLSGLVTHPVRTVECVYVPLMMAASKAADELSIASVTRGIENPKHHTSLIQIHFGIGDVLVCIIFSAFLCIGILGKGAF